MSTKGLIQGRVETSQSGHEEGRFRVEASNPGRGRSILNKRDDDAKESVWKKGIGGVGGQLTDGWVFLCSRWVHV